MKSTDLRIGNIIQFLCEDSMDDRLEWYELNIVDWQDLKILSEREERLSKLPPPSLVKPDYIPMPLTAEMLLKFGFAVEECFYYKKGVWIEDCEDGTFRLEGFGAVIFEYLHELQNLYHTLAGEELEVSIV